MDEGGRISVTFFKPIEDKPRPDSVLLSSKQIVLPTQQGNTDGQTQFSQNKNELLGPKKSFMDFELELSAEEQQSLEQLKISTISHYENYGNLDILQEEVTSYISSIDNTNIRSSEIIARLVSKLVRKVLALTGRETAWVTMRAFVPVPNFKEPRWHADTYYYPPTASEEQYKVAITLKGPSSIFYNASVEERQELEAFRNDAKLLQKKIDPAKIVSAAPGKGTIFIVGTTYGPIHSEPNIHSDRLFLSMIPGSETQIQKLYKQTPEQEITSVLTANEYYCYFVGPRMNTDYAASPYEDTEIIVFRLLNKSEPNPLDILSSIIQKHNSEMRTKVINVRNRNLVQLIFPMGAIITTDDISDFIYERIDQIHSDQDLYILLGEYVESYKLSQKSNAVVSDSKPADLDAAKAATNNQQSTAKAAVEDKRGIRFINATPGRNTSGLFKPRRCATSTLLADANSENSQSQKSERTHAPHY